MITTPAAKAHESFHAYGAFGIAYGLGSLRLGSNNWEVGYLSASFIGYDRIYDINPIYYTTFGVGVSVGGPGFYTGIGFHNHLWIFPVRGELAASMDIKGYSVATGLIGLTYGF